KLAAGRFDVEPVVASKDEIGQLAHDFKSMADQLRNTQMKLIESERMATLGLVGAGITHDVKNPLTGIIGFAELALLDMSKPKEVEDCLRNIHQAGLKAADIIRDFLTYARQGADMQTANLNAVVASGLRMVLYQLRSAKMLVHENYGAAPAVRIRAGQIQQVIMNLAVNAQQAIGKGGNLTVVTRTLADGRAEAEVRDDGPGIPGEIITRIFDPFFTTKAPGSGTGLGLAVCRKIIEEHAGELTVESRPGAGATFRIRLPADDSAQPR
ncbi:MAG: HAMP domain-containing protein, partial [Deltaproteobacteria bacterium]|nr:HAMP domain-containing protein [Deltaproteobacteria bacterium]